MTTTLISLIAAALLGPTASAASPAPAPYLRSQPDLRVVASLTTFAAIAREIVGDRGTVTSIAEGDEDPHFVQPRPSFVPALRDADVFVTTGMDLELWVPALLDRAGNTRVREGGPGYVPAYRGIRLLEVPENLSRSQGDIHVAGNPHIHTDPINAILIARNILAAVQRASPENAQYFAGRQRDFEHRVLQALVGEELVRLLTPEVVFRLAATDSLLPFLRRQTYQGRPLAARLGGWLKLSEPLRGRQMVCYHKEWAYFSHRFGVSCVEYIEAKPGIPPTPRHVQEVMTMMRERRIPVIFASNYYNRGQIREIAERTGAVAVVVSENTEGAPGTDTYFDLITSWITGLSRGFGAGAPSP